MPDLLPEPAGDRLLAEAEKMLLDMQRRFGVPAQDGETATQGDTGDDDSTTLGSPCPEGGHETGRGAA